MSDDSLCFFAVNITHRLICFVIHNVPLFFCVRNFAEFHYQSYEKNCLLFFFAFIYVYVCSFFSCVACDFGLEVECVVLMLIPGSLATW